MQGWRVRDQALGRPSRPQRPRRVFRSPRRIHKAGYHSFSVEVKRVKVLPGWKKQKGRLLAPSSSSATARPSASVQACSRARPDILRARSRDGNPSFRQHRFRGETAFHPSTPTVMVDYRRPSLALGGCCRTLKSGLNRLITVAGRDVSSADEIRPAGCNRVKGQRRVATYLGQPPRGFERSTTRKRCRIDPSFFPFHPDNEVTTA